MAKSQTFLIPDEKIVPGVLNHLKGLCDDYYRIKTAIYDFESREITCLIVRNNGTEFKKIVEMPKIYAEFIINEQK